MINPPGGVERRKNPQPVSRRRFALVAGLIGLIVALNTVGNFIGVSIANHHADRNTSTSDRRNAARDKQHAATELEIAKLEKKLEATQVSDANAVCSLVIGLVLGGKQADPGAPISPLAQPFLTQYHCKIPAGLLTP